MTNPSFNQSDFDPNIQPGYIPITLRLSNMACWKTFHWVRRFSQRTKPPFIVCSSHIFQIYDFPSYKQNFPSIYWDFPWEKHTVRGKLTSATTAPWPWNSAASDTRRRRSPALPGPAWRGAWGAAWQVGRAGWVRGVRKNMGKMKNQRLDIWIWDDSMLEYRQFLM